MVSVGGLCESPADGFEDTIPYEWKRNIGISMGEERGISALDRPTDRLAYRTYPPDRRTTAHSGKQYGQVGSEGFINTLVFVAYCAIGQAVALWGTESRQQRS